MLKLNEWTYQKQDKINDGSGIYVLCSSKGIEKLNNNDECGVLYIGQAKNISARLYVSQGKDWVDKKWEGFHFTHCILSYVLDFKNETEIKFFQSYPEKQRIDAGMLKGAKPRLFYSYCEAPKVEEARLLIGHIMKYGQSPSLNSSSLNWANEYKSKRDHEYYWGKKTFDIYEKFEKGLFRYLIK